MKPEAYHIATLVSKYLRQDMSDQEQATLQAWLDEKEENRALLESFRDTARAQRDVAFLHSLDLDAAWAAFRRRKQRGVMGRLVKLTGYAAAIGIVLAAAWLLWVPTHPQSARVVPDVTNRYNNDVLPGDQKAQLLLSDGREVDLATSIAPLNEEDGTLIAGNDGEIRYVPDTRTVDTLLYNTLIVPAAGTYRIVLSDGTKVWVNALSELRFPVYFGSDERKVFVRGEAYFEVAHDASRPFRVEVNDSEVEVLGTQFNVNAYSSTVATTLVDGAVKVRAGEREYYLSPGQCSYYDGQEVVVQQADVAKETAWKEGDFYFKSDNIIEIMGQLARWYDLQIDYAGKFSTQEGYSGKISRNVKLTEVLEMLRYVSKATFEVDGQRVRVVFDS